MGVALLESTSILPTLILSLYCSASSATMGAMGRHGPHHVAQKSTSTGLSDFKTSWSKFASVTSAIPLPAMFFSPRCNVALTAAAPSSLALRAPTILYECFPLPGGQPVILAPAV